MTTTTATEPIGNRTPEGATEVTKFHVSLNVSDLPRALAFYQALLGAAAVKAYSDYAKFELDDPPVVMSLKPQRAVKGGPLNHLGLRVKTSEELVAIQRRLEAAGYRTSRQEDVRCCYAHQTKFWVADPDDILWEVYVLHGDFERWGQGNKLALMMPSLKALGFFGTIRRALSKPLRVLFCGGCGKKSDAVDNTSATGGASPDVPA
ncbi:MAG: ArsI/CadI family heavy metal resistance metalloenzyme [Gemmataceae bacterium]